MKRKWYPKIGQKFYYLAGDLTYITTGKDADIEIGILEEINDNEDGMYDLSEEENDNYDWKNCFKTKKDAKKAMKEIKKIL